MGTRLVSFEFVPRKHGGWRSPLYRFGEGTTLVTGENGSGKTPMLRGLALALGAKIELPQLIASHCDSVRLTLEDAEGRATVVQRALGESRVQITVDGMTTAFRNEEEFSLEMLRVLGIPPRALVKRADSEPVPPYVSLLTPLFIVDQDNGWRDLYGAPPNLNFVQDQPEECVRWLLDIPQRNSSRTRRDRDEARRRAEALREQLERNRRVLEAMRRQAGDDAKDGVREQLDERRRVTTERLNSLLHSFDGLTRVDASIEAELRAAESDRDSAKTRLGALLHQGAALKRTRDELVAETGVLEANEVAANVFREFCGNVDCNLFRPQDSYGRKLLYLKDQLKDIDTSASLIDAEVNAARTTVIQYDRAFEAVQQRRRQQVTAKGGDTLASEIEALTREIADLAVRLERLQALDAERTKLANLSNALHKADEEVAAMAAVRGSSGGDRLADARTILGRTCLKWLTALRARNLGQDVRFDANVQPYIGGERFSAASPQSGSTRTRIVLALHAALLETSLEMGGHHPWFLVLDAPKQQELHREDLAAFVSACEELFAAQQPPMQLIVGAKERDIFVHQPESIWEPTFTDDDGAHYLGQAGSGG